MPESRKPGAFGTRLRQIRDQRELSQSDLATRAGMQPSAVAHFEAGRRKPSFANARALALALDVSADYLLGITEGTTAFRDEDKLSIKERAYIQNMIDMMLKTKKNM